MVLTYEGEKLETKDASLEAPPFLPSFLPSFPLFSETPPFPAVDCGFQFSLLLSTTTMALLDVNPLFGDRKEGELSGCELQEGGGRAKRVTLLIPDRNLIDDWSCLFSSL